VPQIAGRIAETFALLTQSEADTLRSDAGLRQRALIFRITAIRAHISDMRQGHNG
jgi:hypothetical protein